jgi:hypothetical protein
MQVPPAVCAVSTGDLPLAEAGSVLLKHGSVREGVSDAPRSRVESAARKICFER